jgi:inner membrane protein involved in colicin E2 resistance
MLKLTIQILFSVWLAVSWWFVIGVIMGLLTQASNIAILAALTIFIVSTYVVFFITRKIWS